MSCALENTKNLYFPWESERYKTQMTFFCTTSPNLEVLGWAGGCLLLQIPNNSHIPLAPETHSYAGCFWNSFLHGRQYSHAGTLPPLLFSSRKFVWYQGVAKGNPQTAKSILDVNLLSRLRWCLFPHVWYDTMYFQPTCWAGVLTWELCLPSLVHIW